MAREDSGGGSGCLDGPEISRRVQITTGAHKAYLEAVEDAFGADIDYAQLQKIYGAPIEDYKRYSPATCIGCDIK